MMRTTTVGARKYNRGRIEIIGEILNVATEDVRKTRLMYAANLSFEQVERYLELLVAKGFVEKVVKQDSMTYRTTQAGRTFSESCRSIVQILEGGQFKSVHESYKPN